MLNWFSIEYHETPTNKSGQSGEPIKLLLIADGKHEIRFESHLQGFQIETMQQEEIVKYSVAG